MQKDQSKKLPQRRSDRELGIDPGRISKWRQRSKQVDQPLAGNSALTAEQQQIRRLQRELREAQMDRMAEATRYTKKGRQHLLQDRREVYRFIKENSTIFPVEKMCKVLNVTGPPGGSSSYYYWCKHPVGVRQQNQKKLEEHIRRVHTQSRGRYGSPAPRWPGLLRSFTSRA